MDIQKFNQAKIIWDEIQGYKKDIEIIGKLLNAKELYSNIGASEHRVMFDRNENYMSKNNGFAIEWLHKDRKILEDKIVLLEKQFLEI